MPVHLFSALNLIRKKLILDLNYQKFEKHCFIIKTILMEKKNTFFEFINTGKVLVFDPFQF